MSAVDPTLLPEPMSNRDLVMALVVLGTATAAGLVASWVRSEWRKADRVIAEAGAITTRRHRHTEAVDLDHCADCRAELAEAIAIAERPETANGWDLCPSHGRPITRGRMCGRCVPYDQQVDIKSPDFVAWEQDIRGGAA